MRSERTSDHEFSPSQASVKLQLTLCPDFSLVGFSSTCCCHLLSSQASKEAEEQFPAPQQPFQHPCYDSMETQVFTERQEHLEMGEAQLAQTPLKPRCTDKGPWRESKEVSCLLP